MDKKDTRQRKWYICVNSYRQIKKTFYNFLVHILAKPLKGFCIYTQTQIKYALTPISPVIVQEVNFMYLKCLYIKGSGLNMGYLGYHLIILHLQTNLVVTYINFDNSIFIHCVWRHQYKEMGNQYQILYNIQSVI